MVVATTREVRIEILAGALVPTAAILLITSFRFGWKNGALATTLAVGSLLFHELGHAAAARATGTRLSGLGICLWGTFIRREKAASGPAEFLISAAGPLMNLLICVALWNESGLLGWVAQFNLVLLLANLIPHRGSDGRRMLNTLREIRSGVVQPVGSPAK